MVEHSTYHQFDRNRGPEPRWIWQTSEITGPTAETQALDTNPYAPTIRRCWHLCSTKRHEGRVGQSNTLSLQLR